MLNFKNKIIALILIAATSTVYADGSIFRSSTATALQNSKISASKAIDLATQKVAGQAVSVDFDRDFGTRYEVDIITANGNKHEVKIDANTGAVVAEQRKMGKRRAFNASVSLKQAIQTAIAQTQGTVKEAGLDHDDGFVHYEIETVQANGIKQKIHVDAQTGEVLTAEYDD